MAGRLDRSWRLGGGSTGAIGNLIDSFIGIIGGGSKLITFPIIIIPPGTFEQFGFGNQSNIVA